MKVIINASLGKAQLQKRIGEAIADQAVWLDNADAAIAELAAADALICRDPFISAKIAEAIRRAPNLRWIQLLTAGYDQIKQHGVPPHVTVCNAGPAYAPGVATHAVALLLALQRQLPTALSNQRQHAWERDFTMRVTTPGGTTVAVVGFGPIGGEIGRLLRAFGATVIAVTRRGLPQLNADEVVPVDQLHGVLARADAVIIAAPYDESTRHLMGGPEFSVCKKNAVLVNISRGGIVEPRALEAALRNGTIAGAGIDVTDPEPLPADHSLWDAPNLIITPHCAGASGPIAGERLADLVCDNLNRFVRGASLRHVIAL